MSEPRAIGVTAMLAPGSLPGKDLQPATTAPVVRARETVEWADRCDPDAVLRTRARRRHIVIDTGIGQALAERFRIESDPVSRRAVEVTVDPDTDVGPQTRSIGLRPEDIRLVLLTHLHFDHAGGIEHLPDAEVLAHRTEWDGRTAFGPNYWRLQEPSWTEAGRPRLYDLVPEPYGPFDASLPLTDHGDVVVLPTPGHTRGHVAS